MIDTLSWGMAGIVILICLLVLGRPLVALLRLGLRACGAFLLLSLLQPIGLGVGANVVTALVLGVLGIPGFALLLMLQWTLR